MSEFDKMMEQMGKTKSSSKDNSGSDNLFYSNPADGKTKETEFAQDPWAGEFSNNQGTTYTSSFNDDNQKKGNGGKVALVVGLFAIVLIGVIATGLFVVGGLGDKLVNTVSTSEYDDEIFDYIEYFQNNELKSYLSKSTKSINYLDDTVYAPLYYAILVENYEAMEILLDYGADINLADEISDLSSALAFALYYDDYEAAEILVNRGIDLDTRDNVGMTPLMYATGFENTNYVELLLGAGANPSEQDDYEWAVLHYAAFYGSQENYDLVLAAGASEDVFTEDGYSVSHAALYGENLELLEELIGRGHQLTQPTTNGDTLLHIASSEVMANYVIANYECDFNAKNNDGDSPLHYAVQSRVEAGVLTSLLEHGADPNVQNKEGATPLMYALTDVDKVMTLLAYGADKTIEDRYGANAYDYISFYNEGTVSAEVEALLAQ